MEIKERIIKDIEIFDQNLRNINKGKLEKSQQKVIELAEMYAKDSKSFFDKGDYHTSFSSIAYAHGLLDAIRKINKMGE